MTLRLEKKTKAISPPAVGGSRHLERMRVLRWKTVLSLTPNGPLIVFECVHIVCMCVCIYT